jgi:AcrR family transcriptional regulator
MTKRDLLAIAARKKFIEKGYLQTTIDDIASTAGISKGTFYNNFKSKEDIYVYILNLDVKERMEKFNKTLLLKTSLRKKFNYIAREYLKDCFESPDMSMYRLKVLFSNNEGDSEEIKALKYNLCCTSTTYFEELLELHDKELKKIFQNKRKIISRVLVNSLRMFIYTFLTGEEYFGEASLKSKEELEKNIKATTLEDVTLLLTDATIGGFLK